MVSREAEKRGVTTIQVTHPEQQRVFGKGKLTENIRLGSEDLSEANIALQKAATDLGVDISTFSKYALEAIKRDYINASESEASFIFDNLSPNLTGTKGYTKYITKMATDLGKDVYVYDSNPKNPKEGMNTWFKFNHSNGIFETIPGAPKLPHRYSIFSGKSDKGMKVSKNIE